MTISDISAAVAMLGAGAGAMLALQKFVKGLESRRAPNGEKSPTNGARMSIWEAINDMRTYYLAHGQRITECELEIRALQNRLVALLDDEERQRPTRSVERRLPNRGLNQPDATP